MGILRDLGFHAKPPEDWNGWWLVMWGLTAPALLVGAFTFPLTWGFWWIWVGAAAVLFGVPEWIAVRNPDDGLPPLTHTIRHFLPNWVAFPLLYGLLGAVGSRWIGVGYPRFWGVAAMFALMGWLTDHFTVTYARPDPHPHALGAGEEAARAGMPEATAPPVVRNPRPF